MKTAIIIGRFQPITNAHYGIIKDAIRQHDETYVCIVNSKASIAANASRRLRAGGLSSTSPDQDEESWKTRKQSGRLSKSYSLKKLQDEKESNPYSGMMRKKLIYNAFGGKLHESHIISHPSANIQQIVNKVHYMSKNTEFVLLCGADRKSAYEAQVKSGFEKQYFMPEIESVDVKVIDRDMDSADNVSATRVRQALRDQDREEFNKLTPSGIHNDFDNLRRVLVQEAKYIPFFSKMLTEMIHIEDLKVDEFIEFVRNIYETEASVKLDGTAALAFGFDEDGKFYTGFGRDFKDIKPELRRYSEEDWLKQKSIFVNPAVSAHTFLEKNITKIKKHLKTGETALAELLFGDKPNCIKYDFSGINYAVVLNNPKLAEELNGVKKDIDTVNYVLDAETVVPKAVKQTWRFGKTQRVDPSKYEIDINAELKELEDFLEAETDGVRHIDIIGMRAVGKNKELVKKMREKAQSMKLNIKEKLLAQFVRRVREGDYIPAEGYSHEGIVLKNKSGVMTKIIDKDVFTAIHDRDWEPAHVAKKIQKTMAPEEAIAELDRMIGDFENLYPNVADDMKIRMKNNLRMIKLFIKDKMDV
jgi:nicotinic acid mononucleotide adenylyltransferase